jgi:hypothetical protein
MNGATKDPRCPECGEPIGQTATYCMHCSADLTDEQEVADVDEDEAWEQTPTAPSDQEEQAAREGSDQLLDPEGLVDDTLTVVVGIGGGVVVGLVGTSVLLSITGSIWGFVFGLVAWLGSTAYLVRRRTVQGAIAKTGYAVAVVLLLVPVVALSPFVSVEGGIGGRGELFAVLFAFSLVPASIATAIGWIASQFIPEEAGGESA